MPGKVDFIFKNLPVPNDVTELKSASLSGYNLPYYNTKERYTNEQFN